MLKSKLDKAEKVLDLAMEKMPVDLFEYYSLLEPFVAGYYEVNKPEKAREVYQATARKYQENLLYYSGMKVQTQYGIADEIISDMERYRGLIDVLIALDSEEIARAEADKFNDYLRLFRHFYSEDEGMDLDREMEQDSTLSNPLDSSNLIDAADLPAN